MDSAAQLQHVRRQSDDAGVPPRWRTIIINILVTLTTGLMLLAVREAYFTWQRVNSLMAWAQAQEQARAQLQASQPQSQSVPKAPTAAEPKK